MQVHKRGIGHENLGNCRLSKQHRRRGDFAIRARLCTMRGVCTSLRMKAKEYDRARISIAGTAIRAIG